MIGAALHAEWFKVVRRPAVWITIGFFLALAVGIGYLVTYLLVTHPPAASGDPGESVGALRESLYPASFIPKALSNADTLQAIFALVLGVLIQGSEYGWQTVKTSLIQLPGRAEVMAGRLLALAMVIVIMTVTLFVLDAVTSLLIAGADGKPFAFPAGRDIAKAAGAEWLILAMMAAFGFFLATVFRQSALAIGLGIAYILVIESLGFGLIGALGETVRQLHTIFPVASAGFLQQSFGQVAEIVGLSVGGSPRPDTTRAVMTLIGWVAAFILASVLLMRFRDVV